jgi:hypothetical protein
MSSYTLSIMWSLLDPDRATFHCDCGASTELAGLTERADETQARAWHTAHRHRKRTA